MLRDVKGINFLSNMKLSIQFMLGVVKRRFMNRPSFIQAATAHWSKCCFGPELFVNKAERNCRFAEEAIELCQSSGLEKEVLLQLIDDIYSKPPGDFEREVGGVVTSLACLTEAHGIDFEMATLKEINRVYLKMPEIREKNKNKIRSVNNTEVCVPRNRLRIFAGLIANDFLNVLLGMAIVCSIVFFAYAAYGLIIVMKNMPIV